MLLLLLCNLILKWRHYLIINALGRRLKGQFALNQGLKLHEIAQSVYGDSESSWALPCLPFADKKIVVEHILQLAPLYGLNLKMEIQTYLFGQDFLFTIVGL